MTEQVVRTVFSGDSRGAARSAREVRQELDQLTRGAVAGSGAFNHLGRAMAFASGAFIGASAITFEIKDMIKASKEQGAVTAVVAQQMRNLGLSYQGSRGRIEEYLTSLRKTTGFQDNEMMRVLAQQLRATGNLDEALKRVSLATDLARGRNIDLATASMLVTRGGIGMTGMLRRLGIDIKPVTDNMDALTKAHGAAAAAAAANGEKVTKITADQRAHAKALDDAATKQKVLGTLQTTYAGQAAAYGRTAAGAADRTAASWEHAQEVIGANALPMIANALDKVSVKIDELAGSKKFTEFLHSGADDAKKIATELGHVARAADDVSSAVGGWGNAFEFILTGLLVRKIAAVTGAFTGLAAAETAVAGATATQMVIEWQRTATGGLLAVEKAAEVAAGGTAGATGIGLLLTRMKLLLTRANLLKSLGLITIGVLVDYQILKHFGKDSSGSAPLTAPDGSVWQRTKDHPEGIMISPPGTGPSAGGATSQITTGTSGMVAQQKKIVGYAKSFGPGSGITYTWGGVSPKTGFDCSGYLMAAYGAAGIKIPRDTRGQWNDPNAIEVMAGAEQPGDGVYFTGSLSGANAGPPPGHVGIYIGGGQYIEYFSGGKPAKVSSLGDRGDYMGARRWLKVGASAGGSAPTGGTGRGPGPSGDTSKARANAAAATRAKFGAIQTDFLPLAMRQAIADASLTTTSKDDLAALGQARAYLAHLLSGGIHGQKRLDATNELGGIISQIQGLGGNKPASAVSIGRSQLAVSQLDRRLDKFPALDKVFGPQLDALDKQLRAKVISQETLSEIGLRLSQLKDKISTGIDAAKAAIAARKAAFAAEWGKLAQAGLAAFDKETQNYVSPAQAVVNAMTKAHDAEALQYAVDQAKEAVKDAQKSVDDALKGTVDNASGALASIRQLVGQYGLADQIDIVQSGVLGGLHVSQLGGEFLAGLRALLAPSAVVDPAAVDKAKDQLASAQHSLDEAVYSQKLAGKQNEANLEKTAWDDRRALERTNLENSLDAWGKYFEMLGHKAEQARADMSGVLAGMGLAGILPPTAGQVATEVANQQTGGNTAATVVALRQMGQFAASNALARATHFDIPGYGDGGVVAGPIGMPRLAVVHGGEEVLTPMQRSSGPSSSGSSSMRPLNVQVVLEGDLDGLARFVKVRSAEALDDAALRADIRRRERRY